MAGPENPLSAKLTAALRPAKLICGIIISEKDLISEVESLLQENFGIIDLRSLLIPFDFTDYYKSEMGENLWRQWVSFEKLIASETLPEIKLKTNALENKFSVMGKRRVNLDPGYIVLSRLVLASTKDFAHRIYLKDGIFAEVTLIYKHKEFRPLEWTYPDYRTEIAIQFFQKVREKYQKEIKDRPF
ncbi:MAG: DUF4416 family protein [Candidatus Edwardsbacteria bacterium]